MQMKYVALSGSERQPPDNAHPVGDVDPNEVVNITVHVRARADADRAALLEQLEQQSPTDRQYLTRDEFAQKLGADPNDLAKVAHYARENLLQVIESSVPKRSVLLRGTTADLTRAFPAHLQIYESPMGRFRGRTGVIEIPTELEGIIDAILGFDDRPQASPRQ